jgi:hypothetical protein
MSAIQKYTMPVCVFVIAVLISVIGVLTRG